MAYLLSALCAIALTGVGYAQLSAPFPVDLTIALLESSSSSGNCDLSKAPTMHVYGVQNISEYVFSTDFWPNATQNAAQSNNGTVNSLLNYTITNAQYYSLNVSYTGIYYQQLSGNSTQDQAGKTVGHLKLITYPCANAAYTCNGEQGQVPTSPSLPGDAWLQWSCFAEGSCYQTGYTIKAFSFGDTTDQFANITSAERNNQCQLGTVHYSNESLNNNTVMQGDGATSHGMPSVVGVWSNVAVVLGFLWV